jgi:hypothetical protein
MPVSKTAIAAALNEIDERKNSNESLLKTLPLYDAISSSRGKQWPPNTGFVEISATVEAWLTYFPGKPRHYCNMFQQVPLAGSCVSSREPVNGRAFARPVGSKPL